MNKKASLNLSIQAIVIVVIAFVVLGLGLGFVRGVFDDIGGQTDEIFSSVSSDIKGQIAKSNEPLYFPKEKMNVEAGEEKVSGVGVKNTGDVPLQMQVVFEVRVGSDFVPFISGEVGTFGEGDSEFTAGIFWDDSIQRFGPTEGRAIPITLTAPSKFGNYLYKVKVMKEDGSDFAQKTFFVRTS